MCNVCKYKSYIYIIEQQRKHLNLSIMENLSIGSSVKVVATKGMFEGKSGVIVGSLQDYRFSVKFESEKNPISISGYNLV